MSTQRKVAGVALGVGSMALAVLAGLVSWYLLDSALIGLLVGIGVATLAVLGLLIRYAARSPREAVLGSRHRAMGMAVGLAIGVGFGVALGASLDNMAFIGVGPAFGLPIGLAIGEAWERRARDQS